MRRTKRIHASWEEELRSEGKPFPPIFTLVIGLILVGITVGTLHCMDLGVTAHVLGKLLMMIVKKSGGAAHKRRGLRG